MRLQVRLERRHRVGILALGDEQHPAPCGVLGVLLANFNCTGRPGCQGDADGDGDTDQADLGILLKFYGQECG